MTLLATGPLIVDGQPRLGRFENSLAQLNLADFRYLTPFGKPHGALPRWLHFKRFQYFGAMSPRVVFGCAMADLRYVGAVFVYVYDFERQTLWSRSLRRPLARGLELADNPVSGISRFKTDSMEVQMHYAARPHHKRLLVDMGPELQIDALMMESDFEPMSLCTRTGYSGWVYANKTAGLPLQGELRFHGHKYKLEALQACGHHDFSCGYMRRETFWNWACFSGMADGRCVGLNLSCGVNETSHTENCLWVDGRLVKVNLARFDFDRSRVLQPWLVHSDDGQVELSFTPQGLHRELLKTGVVNSNFKQLFGHFNGELRLPGGTLAVHQMPGFVEDQYAKW